MSQRSFYSLAAIVVIFFISYAYIHLDLPTGDESGYLFHGLSQFLSLGWAPLYGEWYRFLNFFIINLVDLYRVNYVITTLAPTFMLLAYLRLRSIPILYQLCALLLALSIWGSPNVVSRSGHLAIAIILLRTIQCEIQNKKSLVGNSINALMFYLVSFLRGDLFIGYLWYLGKISFDFLTKKTSISIRCSTIAMVGILILPLVFRLTPCLILICFSKQTSISLSPHS